MRTWRIGCALVVIAALSLGVPPASGSAEIQWKAILLAGDSSAPVFDNATRDLARLLERRGVQVVATFSADRAKVSPTVQHADDFDSVVFNPEENHMRSHDHRSQTGQQVVPLAG